MNIGEKIEEIILVNSKIWHLATQVKDITGRLHKNNNMTREERVKCALDIRRVNADRSKIRWEIDSFFGEGTNETKIFSGDK